MPGLDIVAIVTIFSPNSLGMLRGEEEEDLERDPLGHDISEIVSE